MAGCSGNIYSSTSGESSAIPKEFLVAPTPCRVDHRHNSREEAAGKDGDTLGRQLGLGPQPRPFGGREGTRPPGRKSQMTSQMLGLHMEALLGELTTPCKMLGGLHFSFSTELSKVKLKRTDVF